MPQDPPNVEPPENLASPADIQLNYRLDAFDVRVLSSRSCEQQSQADKLVPAPVRTAGSTAARSTPVTVSTHLKEVQQLANTSSMTRDPARRAKCHSGRESGVRGLHSQYDIIDNQAFPTVAYCHTASSAIGTLSQHGAASLIARHVQILCCVTSSSCTTSRSAAPSPMLWDKFWADSSERERECAVAGKS